MTAHDATEVRIEADQTTVVCRCGRVFTAPHRSDATTAHAGHHGVEHARQALAGRPHLELVPDPEGTD